MIADDRLREDVIGFIGQEAMHAQAHQSLLGYFSAEGLDTDGFIAQLRWFFEEMLGDRGLSGKAAHGWLIERVAIIAAIEHVTSFLGDWILGARGLDTLDKHEKAEAVLDLFTHLDGRYLHRVRAHLVAFPVLLYWWVRGLRCLMAEDPLGAGKPRWRDWFRGARRGLPRPRRGPRSTNGVPARVPVRPACPTAPPPRRAAARAAGPDHAAAGARQRAQRAAEAGRGRPLALAARRRRHGGGRGRGRPASGAGGRRHRAAARLAARCR
ncbi:metal-dependent hydrolase [Streptomyces sp. MI02-7b]|uniref:metal-dependent hydrolase n=1 Tax=Streptomyces sp. MI02-7b TaxID=462941 RepID=UPI0039F623F9